MQPASSRRGQWGWYTSQPHGCRQLQSNTKLARLSTLATVAAAAAADGAPALLSGDFNARVGSLSDNVPLPGGSNDGQRGCTDQTNNAYGKAIIKFCQRTGLALRTGRVRSDERGTPTFTSGARPRSHRGSTTCCRRPRRLTSSAALTTSMKNHSTGR